MPPLPVRFRRLGVLPPDTRPSSLSNPGGPLMGPPQNLSPKALHHLNPPLFLVALDYILVEEFKHSIFRLMHLSSLQTISGVK